MLPGAVDARLWARCSSPGCRGAAVAPGELCLAHLPDEVLAAELARYGRGRSLDVRGVQVGADLWARILDAMPVDQRGRRLPSKARFDGAVFEADIVLDEAWFGQDACFEGARFAGFASFRNTTMLRQARFSQAHFDGPVRFDGARLDGAAWFAGIRFDREVSFEAARIGSLAWFTGTLFASDAFFRGVTFGHEATFEQAGFGCHTEFDGATFENDARFGEAAFARSPTFTGAAFRGPAGVPAVADGRRLPWWGPPLGRWPRRAAAAMIDWVVFAALVGAGLGASAFLRWIQQGSLAAIAPVAGLAAGVLFAGRNLADQGRSGQTVGKRRLGLRVIGERSRRPVGAWRSVARQALHVADSLPAMLGWLWPLWDRKRQTFADKLVRTVVLEVGEDWHRRNADRPEPAVGTSGFG